MHEVEEIRLSLNEVKMRSKTMMVVKRELEIRSKRFQGTMMKALDEESRKLSHDI